MGAVASVFAQPARLQDVPVGRRRSAAARWERRLDGDRLRKHSWSVSASIDSRHRPDGRRARDTVARRRSGLRSFVS